MEYVENTILTAVMDSKYPYARHLLEDFHPGELRDFHIHLCDLIRLIEDELENRD